MPLDEKVPRGRDLADTWATSATTPCTIEATPQLPALPLALLPRCHACNIDADTAQRRPAKPSAAQGISIWSTAPLEFRRRHLLHVPLGSAPRAPSATRQAIQLLRRPEVSSASIQACVSESAKPLAQSCMHGTRSRTEAPLVRNDAIEQIIAPLVLSGRLDAPGRPLDLLDRLKAQVHLSTAVRMQSYGSLEPTLGAL